MTKNTSAVFLFDGRSGLGKTTVSSQVGCYIARRVAEWKDKTEPLLDGELHKPKFILDDMVWTPEKFIDKLKTATKGDIIIMDESMILSNRSAMSSYNKAIVIMMSMIRSKQIFVFFNTNSIFDIDRNLVLHRADMLIHLYAEDDKFAGRGRYFVVPSARGKLKDLYIIGKKYYDYSKSKIAFRDKYSAFFPFDNDEYERRKQEAINEYFRDNKGEMNKKQVYLKNLIKYLKDKLNLSIEDISNISKIPLSSVYRYLDDSKNS